VSCATPWTINIHFTIHILKAANLIAFVGFPFMLAILALYLHPFDAGLDRRCHTVGSNLVRFQVSPINPIDY
jgi:hypothetical protein